MASDTDMEQALPDPHRFPCDACGADLRFRPGQSALVCDHCGNVQQIAEARGNDHLREIDLARGLGEDLSASETTERRLTHCDNCGAEIEFGDAEHATECPFCASPVVIGTGTTRQIKPRAVAPFAISEQEARDAMTRWLGRLWFAPGKLQEYARKGRKMQGVYVPYWTYDADTKSSYRGERGTVYYETRTVVRDGKRVQQRVQKVRWRPKSGRVARFFDDVLILASRALPKRFTDALQPWKLAELEPYTPEYLAGFSAEGYTVPLGEGFKEAQAIMEATIRRDVKFDIGGDRQRIHDIDTAYSGLTFKHILLPVWVAAYRYGGKSYRFVVNGQTGKVQGERPWSAIKIAVAVLVVAALAAALGYFAAISEAGGGV